jgi:LytS/YehU family sensor histidine kinase
VTVIFTQFLITGASPLQVAISVIVFVTLNAFVSQAIARRGRSWRSMVLEFVAMMVINLGMALILEAFEVWVGIRSVRIPIALTLFLVFLVTVLVVLFDRYHTVFRARGILDQRLKERHRHNGPGADVDGGPGAAPAGA